MNTDQNKEAIKLIMNSALDAIICMDRQGLITMWTKQAEKIFGWMEEEVKGKQLSEIIVPQRYRERHKAGLKRYLEGGNNKVLNRLIEIEGLHRTGNEFPIELTITPIRQDDNEYFCAFLRDISERKKIEENFRKSELRYHSLINHASDAIFVTDMEFNFIDVNESMCALSGYSKEELLNMNAGDLVETSQLKENPIPFERFKAGEHVTNERRILRKDGSIIDMEVNSKKMGDANILGIARDITQRKKADEMLIKSEQKYRSLIEQASDPIMVTDFKGNFIDVNTSLCSIFGYSKDELLRLNITSLIDPQNLKVQPMKFELLATGQHVFSQRRMMKRDGSFIEVEANVKKVDENHVMAIVRDVTELRKVEREIKISEERFRGAFEYSAIGMAIANLEGKWVKVNRELSRITGYSEKELLELSYKEITHPEDLPGDIRNVEKMLSGKIESYRSEKRYIHKAGTIVWCNTTVSMVRDPQGIPLYFVAQIENITERKKAEDEVKRSQNTLRELSAHLETIREEERTSIAREIHDELGQQLTGLKMDLSSLKKKIPGENKDAHKKAVSMMSLLDVTMKTVRHISSELRPGILDDLGLIDAIHWQGIEFEKRTGVTCQFKTRLRNGSFQKEFSTGIFRVFQETLTNVARHAKATKINTTLEADKEHVILKVHDNGKGFDQEGVKKKNTLGLIGMQERAMMFGGKITIESEKGKGTTVILQVPLKGTGILKK